MLDPRRPDSLKPLIAALFLVAFAALPQPARAQDADDVVRVNTGVVVFNVTVADGSGKYAHGLQKSDFKLFVDHREQGFSGFSVEETPFAAAILIDTSGSMEGRLSLARAAAIHFLEGLRADDVAAVYRFDSRIEQVQDFSSSRDLDPIAFGLRADGQTSLLDAVVKAANDLSARSEQRRAIIVLSDGGENSSSVSLKKATDRALAIGATIYAIDMSVSETGASRDLASAAILRSMALKTGGRYVPTPGGRQLREALAGILEEMGNQYTLTFTVPVELRDGRWHDTQIELSRAGLKARTRKGYQSTKP